MSDPHEEIGSRQKPPPPPISPNTKHRWKFIAKEGVMTYHRCIRCFVVRRHYVPSNRSPEHRYTNTPDGKVWTKAPPCRRSD